MSSSQQTPDGWVSETRVSGMRADDDLAGGYKCDSCSHYIPIKYREDASCPACGASGLIGTIVNGRQEVTYLFPEDAPEVDGGGD